MSIGIGVCADGKEAVVRHRSPLEYGYDDWAIYHMAKKMGDREVADTYLKRPEPINIWWTSVWVLSWPKNAADR